MQCMVREHITVPVHIIYIRKTIQTTMRTQRPLKILCRVRVRLRAQILYIKINVHNNGVQLFTRTGLSIPRSVHYINIIYIRPTIRRY